MTAARARTVAVLAVLAALVAALPALAVPVVKPPTNARIDDNYDTTGTRAILKLKVTGAVVGTVAKVTCKGGKKKGCPAPVRGKTKRIKARKAGSLSLRSALKGNKLAKGAVVTITLTDPGALYYKRVFTIDDGKTVSSQGLCQQATGPDVGCV